MTDSALIDAAIRWVNDTYKYNNYHLIKALEWLDRIAPDASTAMRIATVTHDMERAFPGPDQPVAKTFDDAGYYAAHSARSARIVGEWLQEQGAGDELVRQVDALIRAHETGGWPEADLVQAADSLSFLETNVDLFLDMIRAGRRTVPEVRVKFNLMYERVRVPRAKEIARDLRDKANARLAELRLTNT